jgi:hypothetical protein
MNINWSALQAILTQLQALINPVAVQASGVLMVPRSKATAAVVEAKAVSAETKLGAGSDEA